MVTCYYRIKNLLRSGGDFCVKTQIIAALPCQSARLRELRKAPVAAQLAVD